MIHKVMIEAKAENYASIAARLKNAEMTDDADACDAFVVDADVAARESQSRQAAESGKHVFVEMPIASTSAAAESIIESCREAGVRLMAGNPKRFLPSVQTVKESIDSGKLGEPGLLRIHSWNAASEIKETTLTSRLVGEIDLAVWLFGEAPTHLFAVGNGKDYVQVHLGFPDGGMALIDLASLPSTIPYYALSLIGSTGAAYADDHHNMQLLYREGKLSALTATQGNGQLLAQFQEFVDAIVEKREPSITGVDACRAWKITEAVVESMTNARAAQLTGGRYELV